MIKLLIGGSPCTYWSIAQKNGRETEASGIGWELFKNYLIAKEKFNPDYFLYENNKSAAQPIKDQISHELGVPLMHINSALVSAQNRQRFYAFNWEVEQPEDRGILLRDILESRLVDGEKSYPLKSLSEREIDYMFRKEGRTDYGYIQNTNRDKAQCITANIHKGVPYNCLFEEVGEPIRIGDIGSTAQAHRVYSCDGKSAINAGGGGQGGKTGLYATPVYHIVPTNEKTVYDVKNGFITIKGKQYPIKLADGYYIIRKLTPIECERLQTLPDNYTAAVSNAQRYKGLGNGWTAEVIIHILNGVLKDVPRDEEIVVLSMYDGIGTGRYCLDKMGFTNVRYFAYEIDKYAKQVAMSNYPDIIQLGDAFDVRHPDWTIGY